VPGPFAIWTKFQRGTFPLHRKILARMCLSQARWTDYAFALDFLQFYFAAEAEQCFFMKSSRLELFTHA
jgi:hypothetical protein